ncbi:hypothetical protein [Escherichia coli]|uniref:hypothetical protein n=1 Tax=Escherichia coli TaxID=562 RepID=UPI0035A8A110
MIVKFHARGKGGGSGPVDYLLGRERNREGATVLRGNPEEIRELIDATPFSMPRHFEEIRQAFCRSRRRLPPGERERVMTSFERVLMPVSKKTSTAFSLGGTFELNFVIPNMELQSGKRFQPYYDRADRPRIKCLADAG